MAGRGPAPKEAEKRRGHTKPPPTQELQADRFPARAPGLGQAYRERGNEKKIRYLTETRTWWKTWVESPQAQQFTATDWQRLKLLAPVVDRFIRGDHELLSEIRLNEQLLGATPIDRLRLQWKIVGSPKAREDPRGAARRRRDPRLQLVQ
jgi:hypothetical protein